MTSSPVKRPIWAAEGQEKRSAVRGMFAEIAPTYDLANSLMSFRSHKRWRAIAVAMLNLKPGERVLDLCSGTGDFMASIRKRIGPTGLALGVDFCEPMLRVAQKKYHESFALGDGCRLPLRKESFDAVTVGWGIRNVPDIDLAHKEIARVLKRGGRFVSIDMSVPRSSIVAPVAKLLFHRLVPLLGRSLGKSEAYAYLPKSTDRFKTRVELVESMKEAGFKDVIFRDLFLGTVCVHFGVKA